MKKRSFVGRNHASRFSALLILFLAASVILPSAGADSLFTLAATPTPKAAPTSAPAPSGNAQDLFGLLATAAPAAGTISASERFRGLSYTDLTGKTADRVYENKEDGTWGYVYEQVPNADYRQYGAYLSDRGCTTESVKTDTENAVALMVRSREKTFCFRAVYQGTAQRLTLIFSDREEPETTPQPAAIVTAPAASASPEVSPTVQWEETICSHCDYGFCINCGGIGYFLCDSCGGMGVCPSCNGKGQIRIPGFNGVGTATYVTCSGCGGSGKCSRCGGTRKQDCPACDGGKCPYCHGDYFLDP